MHEMKITHSSILGLLCFAFNSRVLCFGNFIHSKWFRKNAGKVVQKKKCRMPPSAVNFKSPFSGAQMKHLLNHRASHLKY